jgi:type IV pilus assembly protein PilO
MALVPDDPKQRNALVIGIIALAGFYFFWSYWYSPTKTEVDEMTARQEQLDSENNRAQIIATRGGTELQDRLAMYERHVGLLEALIPQREEVATLLNDVTTVARQTGVELASLNPEADEIGSFYTKQSYALEVVGEYHDLGRFLGTIASLPRIITPVNLELARFQGQGGAYDMEQPLTATFQIQTYILPTPSSPPAGGGPGQPGGQR